MTNIQFRAWLAQRDACTPALDWLGDRTPEQAWHECEMGEWLVWWLNRAGLDDSTIRLLACDMVRYTPLADGRTTWDLLTDERSRHAVEVAERYAMGEATDQELRAAWDVAWDAVRAAAWAAARDAARDAAWAAAGDAARAAAWDVARAVARAAAWDAVWAVARKAQADLIRKRLTWEMVEGLMNKQLQEVQP